MMSIDAVIRSKLIREESGVLVLKDHTRFAYSDGRASEKYLEEVFRTSSDLSSTSAELERRAKDWTSEYHLTRKRAQLLSGFTFDRSSRVLEVGCGCGAITRFLGETFEEVVSIEGSIHRARLARARTRDLANVEIINAPFQKIEFTTRFQVIVCVGVFEYSGAFVNADDPYDAVLKYFMDLLTDDGVVIIAIENQFGLKYFTSSREDHVPVMFEGIEGYHSKLENVRTFGSVELERMLKQYFPLVDFYYPYPDYKIPDCVIAHEMLASGRAGEIVSMMKSRDYAGDLEPLWNESLASLELARNRMLPFFSNSFVVIAGNRSLDRAKFDQQAIMYSSGRIPEFSTRTRVVDGGDGRARVVKELSKGGRQSQSGDLTLVACESEWIDGLSLHTKMLIECRDERMSDAKRFAACRIWLEHLNSRAVDKGGVSYLEGKLIDCLWSNTYVDERACMLVDQEWEWREPVRLNVVVIRAIYYFLGKTEHLSRAAPVIRGRSARKLIEEIAALIGVRLTGGDFDAFVDLESRYQALVFAVDQKRQALYLRWYLRDRKSLRWAMRLRNRLGSLKNSVSVRAEALKQRIRPD